MTPSRMTATATDHALVASLFGGRAAGGSHRSARGAPEISVLKTDIHPIPGDFGVKILIFDRFGQSKACPLPVQRQQGGHPTGTELPKRADLTGSKRNSAVAALWVIFLTQQLAVGKPTIGAFCSPFASPRCLSDRVARKVKQIRDYFPDADS